ncbi:MAG TPA: ABC transporter substrate-binding protein [Candidatus Angelobacter sp.]|nr:ABC transporter substrate-binding protein [Candidatus Angelobacter sp.]
MPRRPPILTHALVIGLAVVACAAPVAAPSPPEATGLERTDLTVGTLPIVDAAPIHLALREGYFADEGLTVTVELVQGGAAAIPALIAGDLQVAYGAWPSFLRANAAGLDLRAIADGTRARPGFSQLLALPGSELEGNPAGMAGATIAVNTLGNIGELAIRATLVRAGLGPDAAELVEIGFPDMVAALERGDVDVIWASEPVATLARDAVGAVLVADTYVDEMAGFPVAGYQASTEFVADHPRAIDAFRRALERAVADIAADPTVVADLVPSFTGLDAELASRVAMPEFRAGLVVADLERVQEQMLDLGLLDAPLDLDALVHRGG